MNAEMLRKRRRRYSGESSHTHITPCAGADEAAFLWIFIGMLMIMTYHLLFLPPQVSKHT